MLVELRDERTAHRLDLGRDLVIGFDRRRLDREMRRRIDDLIDVRALAAFDQHFYRAVGQFQHLQDVGDRADRIQVFGRGFVLGRGLLRDQHDALAGFHRGLERLDGFWTADKQWNDHMREYHHVAQGQ